MEERSEMASRNDVPRANGTPTSHESTDSQRTQTQTQASHELGPDFSLSPDPEEQMRRKNSHASSWSRRSSKRTGPRDPQRSSVDYDVPQNYRNLDEVAEQGPVQNPDEAPFTQYRSLEDARRRDEEKANAGPDSEGDEEAQQATRVSRWTTQLYTISYLILFSFLGTLARLGLQVLTDYAGAPVFPSVWFNFGGSLVMGFLAEDRMLFRNEWGTATYDKQIRKAKHDVEEGDSDAAVVDLAAAKKAHQATKKTIPLYIGLATGFCGSFTSFSSFIRDIFLAMSNDLPPPGSATTVPRNGGYSFMALLAVIIITVTASLSGLFIGAHVAIASEPFIPSLPYHVSRKVVDRLGVFLGWGCWVGALLLTAMPPHDAWRGDATFALVFAPLGTLTRFYLSLWLNARKASFPLGTFAANVLGTAVLGMAWDLQRVPLGGVLGCQALQGIEDGFCGCLTTISTWVAELSALRRTHAWVYGAASVLASFGVMVIIMGGLRWTEGFAGLQCVH